MTNGNCPKPTLMELRPQDRDLVSVVREDLVHLEQTWTRTVSDPQLRIASTVLRRLCVDGDFAKAWRALGLPGQPKVRAPDLEGMLRGVPFDRIAFAAAAGANFGGGIVTTPIHFRGDASDLPMLGQEAPATVLMKLTKFVDSPCMIIQGRQIPRHTLITYVANKLGGAHLDDRRDPSSSKDSRYQLLDEALAVTAIGGKRSVYSELLACGQSIVASRHTRAFLKASALFVRAPDWKPPEGIG
ncbi:MAG: hypothetical protein L6Q99_13995 [Planctomycetes bacterium]|nr:hypothetical protein [Planctomycetota bacterium]